LFLVHSLHLLLTSHLLAMFFLQQRLDLPLRHLLIHIPVHVSLLLGLLVMLLLRLPLLLPNHLLSTMFLLLHSANHMLLYFFRLHLSLLQQSLKISPCGCMPNGDASFL
jgi:hypothetical protein